MPTTLRAIDILTFLSFSSVVFVVLTARRRSKRAIPPPIRPLVRRRSLFVAAEQPAPRGLSAMIDQRVSTLLARSTIRTAPATAMLLTVCLSLTGGAVAFTFDAPVWMQVVICIVTFSATWCVFVLLTARRMAKFNRQFPVALELMARATRAGENFEAALTVASRTSEEPLKSEFAQSVEQIKLGHTHHRATEDLARRIGTIDTYLLSHVLAMHQEVGGKLADSLERLSDIIRERTEFAEKMKSTTGIARFAIAAVTLIGIFVFIYMQAAQPEYIAKLLDSRLGRQMIAYGIVSELVGLAWVALTLRTDL